MTREEYEKSLNYVVNGEQQPCNDAISREPFRDSTICEGISCNACSFNRMYKGGCILEERVMKLPSVTPQQKIGHWIETAEEYYKAINEKGGGVNENTPYFTDDIACSECLAKFSVIDNETERFICCPNCGSKMESEGT